MAAQTSRAARPARYTPVAIAFHWGIAALVLAQLWLGWRMGRVEGMDRFTLFQLHKSVGITVLVATLLRLGWRVTHPAPPYPATLSPRERRMATAAHWLFYAATLVLPLSGWVIVSASPLNLPTLLFKTVPWPHLPFVHALPVAARGRVAATAAGIHVWLAWSLLALIALHVAAALKHQFGGRDAVLWRMLPLFRRPAPLDEV